MEEDKTSGQDVIFFFGAGASVDAGVPDTYGFVTDFTACIQSTHLELHETLSEILKVRETFNEKVYGPERKCVDVEQLLDILRRLIDREQEPLLNFYPEKKFCLNSEQSTFLALKTLLENYIRENVIIKDLHKLLYLQEILNFETPIEIYSTNYDTCIEQLSYLSQT